MSVQYLVDFENVHEAGLLGMDLLTPEDSVYVLHTSLTDKIALSTLDNVQAWVRVIPVLPGSQSLDMHLASFLGYLIGKEEDPETRYVIVSNDTDYWGITSYWNKIYQKLDKVQCARNVGYLPDVGAMMDRSVSFGTHLAVREFIIRMFEKNGKIGLNGKPCILLSELCTWLNSLPEYILERRRLNKKPMQYLTEEHQDILLIRKLWNQEWAFLLTENLIPPDAEEPAEEEIPDIMDMGDLSIYTETAAEETQEETEPLQAAEEAPSQEETAAVAEEPKEPDCLGIALQMIRDEYIAGRNDRGHIRASVLRNELRKIPQFRAAMKASGTKSIRFMKDFFQGKIDIYMEKGTYWAAESGTNASEDNTRNGIIDERRKTFYEKAVSSIQSRLSDAGLDQEVANEIADICMHSNSADEPRKEIHNLLCRRYGNKIGAKYYRQTVKYLS